MPEGEKISKNLLVFVAQKDCVLCEVVNNILYIIYMGTIFICIVYMKLWCCSLWNDGFKASYIWRWIYWEHLVYIQFPVVGEGSGVGMSSENKLQFNSSGVAPVEGRVCCWIKCLWGYYTTRPTSSSNAASSIRFITHINVSHLSLSPYPTDLQTTQHKNWSIFTKCCMRVPRLPTPYFLILNCCFR